MAEADLDGEDAGPLLAAAADGAFSTILWDGCVAITMLYEEEEDAWLLAIPYSPDRPRICVFEVPAVHADSEALSGDFLRLLVVRAAAEQVQTCPLAPPFGELVPERWAATEILPDPASICTVAGQLAEGDLSFAISGPLAAGGAEPGGGDGESSRPAAAAGGGSLTDGAFASAGSGGDSGGAPQRRTAPPRAKAGRGAAGGPPTRRTTVASLATDLQAAVAAYEARARQLDSRLAALEGIPGPRPAATATARSLDQSFLAPPSGDAGALWQGAAAAARAASMVGPPPPMAPPTAAQRPRQPLWAPAAPPAASAGPGSSVPECRLCMGPCAVPGEHFPNWTPAAERRPGPGQDDVTYVARVLGESLARALPGGGGDEGGPLLGGAAGSAMARGTAAVQEIWRTTKERPDRVISETVAELRRRQGLAPHEAFTLVRYSDEVNRIIPTFRTLRKMNTMLAHLFDSGFQDGVGRTQEGARLLAHILQCFKVTEAASRSNGAFCDWDLLPYPDPEGTGHSLALPGERAALAARRREEALLAQAASSAAAAAAAGRGAAAAGPAGQQGDGLQQAPPRRARRGQGGAEGDGRGGAKGEQGGKAGGGRGRGSGGGPAGGGE